jgi:HEAT repeat protein
MLAGFHRRCAADIGGAHEIVRRLICGAIVKLVKSSWAVVALLQVLLLAPPNVAQPLISTAGLLLQFDNEHDLSAKERLLHTITAKGAVAGPSLLNLAESTQNSDTRWMAMRGIVMLHYAAAAPFLEKSLKDSDSLVRANAARALGDLQIKAAADPLLAMFAAEKDPGALQQASLAVRLLNITAAAPYLRDKMPDFTGQTRDWLIQALGGLGSAATDVPLIAQYLDDDMTSDTAADAI